MWHISSYVFCLFFFETISSSINTIPVIYNVSLQLMNYNATIINGTCDECLCTMLLNMTSISAFNCFQNNKTCEMFYTSLETSSFLLMNNSASSVYFTSLPSDNQALTSTAIVQSTSSYRSELYFDFFQISQ